MNITITRKMLPPSSFGKPAGKITSPQDLGIPFQDYCRAERIVFVDDDGTEYVLKDRHGDPESGKRGEGCIEDMRCPQCGNHDTFHIGCLLMVKATENGSSADDISQDHEWDDGCVCVCPECEFRGEVGDFKDPGEPEPSGDDEPPEARQSPAPVHDIFSPGPKPVIAEIPEAILQIARRIKTQNNRATQAPMFQVRGRRRIYGMDTEHTDDVVWIETTDGAHEVDPPEDEDNPPEDVIRTGFVDVWEVITTCFTEEGCHRNLDEDGHNHERRYEEVEIYAESFRRNPEMLAIRDFLLGIADKYPEKEPNS